MKSPIHTFRVVTADKVEDWPNFIRSPEEIDQMLTQLLARYGAVGSKISTDIETWAQIQALRWVLKLRDDLKTI